MARAAQGVLVFRSWGGRRPGAGRPPAPGRRAVAHRRRALHDPRLPVHVTLRAATGIPSLRGPRVFAAVRRADRTKTANRLLRKLGDLGYEITGMRDKRAA